MALIGSERAIRTPEFKKKKDKRRNIRLTLFIFCIAILIGGPILIARLPGLQIKDIQVSGLNLTSPEDVDRIVAANLEGNYSHIFPRSNSLLYPKQKIVSDLLYSIPRFKSVSVSRHSLSSLIVEVSERTPAALYCDDLCYFMDSDSYIYSEAPASSTGSYLIYKKDPALETPLRTTLLPEETFRKINSLVSELNILGIYPVSILIKNSEYHLYTRSGADISWNSSRDPESVYRDLSAFLLDKDIVKETNFFDKVLYIDMRFDNKIFYKLR